MENKEKKFNLTFFAFILSLVSIPLQISCLLMVNHDPSGLNLLIRELKPLTYYGGLIISASAFLLGGITLFIKTSSKKHAVITMLISALSVLIFYVMLIINLMRNFPA
jgi:hypothetical protein